MKFSSSSFKLILISAATIATNNVCDSQREAWSLLKTSRTGNHINDKQLRKSQQNSYFFAAATSSDLEEEGDEDERGTNLGRNVFVQIHRLNSRKEFLDFVLL